MNLLCIDTGTDVCSIAVFKNDGNVAERNSKRDFSHAAVITVFIQECLSELDLTIQQLDAIAISSGPGSYTGLRVGASVAKGICFGAKLPLISIDSLTSLAFGVESQSEGLIVPLIDARRDEAYAAVYDYNYDLIEPMKKIKVDEDFIQSLGNSKIVFCGDAAFKTDLWLNETITKTHENSNAKTLFAPAIEKFNQKLFEDIAYFSPLYLSNANVTVSKKKYF